MSAALALDFDVDEDREAVRRYGLREFVRLAWYQVNHAPIVWNWHIDAICEHLEAVARREIRDLVINIPPGTSKSMLTSVLWPAWMWALDPTRRFIVASYAERVVLRDARKNRTLVDSEWFQARWPHVKIPRDRTASTALGVFNTSVEGMRFSTTIPGGDLVGQHCNDFIVDDPINPYLAGSASGVGLDAVEEWWSNTPGRFLDHATSTRTLTMQRVHERDLSKVFIAAGATVLCLPMRYERAHPLRYAKDPRTEEGELLCPARIPPAEVDRIERVFGPTKTAAQHQQRPSPAGGNVFQRKWLQNYWVVLPAGGTWTLSLDCSFKRTADADYVCLQVWYAVGANFYLVDQLLERLSFTETCKALIAWSGKYPKATEKLVEDKANGTAVIDSMHQLVPGMLPIEPDGGKEARAFAVQPLFAAGNVFLPHPTRAEYPDGRKGAPWVRGPGITEADEEAAAGSYEHSMVTFPNAANDDDVDATTQYLNHVRAHGLALFEAAMANMAGFFMPAPAARPAVPSPAAEVPAAVTEADLEALLPPPSAPVHAIRVRPHGTDLLMLGALASVLGDLPGAAASLAADDDGRPLVDADGCVTVVTTREGWVRFALERQGYVREVFPAQQQVPSKPADAGRGWR